MMVDQQTLRKYARLAVRTGVNVQPGQLMVLVSSVDCAPFARLCVEEAYLAGAGQVQVNWTDEQTDRLRFEHEEETTLASVPNWQVEQRRENIQRKCCFLYIESDTPGLLAHIPSAKLQAASLARRAAMEPFEYYTMANHGQWSIVAIPTPSWAAQVFPALDPDAALERLWDAVLASVRIRPDNDPVEEWRLHDQALLDNSRRMNDYHFRSLHFVSGLGTDLTVELVPRHVWAGGGSLSRGGAFFNPNMPTEEIFSMPLKTGVNGVVYASKPLDYQGKLIRDFWLRFQDGAVVDFGAAQGLDALKNLVEFDEGSRYLGEVALVPHHSPISQSGILFLNTLFDENASCHLALGQAYPENVQGGEDMTLDELAAAGANYSKEHCDFMFGTADLSITGLTQDGKEVPVFRNGAFVPQSGFVGG